MGFLLYNQNIHLHQTSVAAEALNLLPTSRQYEDEEVIGLMGLKKIKVGV